MKEKRVAKPANRRATHANWAKIRPQADNMGKLNLRSATKTSVIGLSMVAANAIKRLVGRVTRGDVRRPALGYQQIRQLQTI